MGYPLIEKWPHILVVLKHCGVFRIKRTVEVGNKMDEAFPEENCVPQFLPSQNNLASVFDKFVVFVVG
jgi:hypothetical protein